MAAHFDLILIPCYLDPSRLAEAVVTLSRHKGGRE